MSSKINNSFTGICDRCNKRNLAFYPFKATKMTYRPVKKVIPSKKLPPNTSIEAKCLSTGVINKNKVQNTRKVTRSDIHFHGEKSVPDFCKTCGDGGNKRNGSSKSSEFTTLDSICHDLKTQVAIDKERNEKKNIKNKSMLIHQYYKNEKFKPSSSSLKGPHLKNSSKLLDPITEGAESQKAENSSEFFKVYSNCVEEVEFLDPGSEKNIEDLKNFRNKNYFECHSAKSRVTSKGSVTSLNDHRCVYRFYLNDRLFPVPLHTDYQNSIRCIECHLPLEDINSEDSINGTVQAKVKIDNEVQDMILMLPVKRPLIMDEKRKKSKVNDDVLYFGVVKLNYSGDSVFNRALPNDSLALRYQKGYKEFSRNEKYHYEKIEENDVIVI